MAHHAATWITFFAAWVLLIVAAIVANYRGRQAQPPTPVKPADHHNVPGGTR